ncbi:MAG TPA: hypothetical protein VKV69_07265 [Actinomycetota bacterium]|nr:hypothetical protein [Actinomycetota bacterium]
MQVEEKQQDMQAAQQEKEMCCDDSGRTADEHRAESPDGKCCIDG